MTAPIVFIIGCGDYIGAAIARRFASGGFTVCMARRNGDRLAPLSAEITDAGGRAYGYTLDARNEDSVKDIFAQVEAEVGALDLVICNVGGNVKFALRDTTARVFRKVWEMACFAGFLAGREAAYYMMPRNRGAIFLIGVSASKRGTSGYAAFSAAKAGQRALAQSMAKELGPQNIHVAHLVIDARVDTAFVRDRVAQSAKDPDTLMNPQSVAEAYWHLYHQPRDGWTFEMDLRP